MVSVKVVFRKKVTDFLDLSQMLVNVNNIYVIYV